MEIYTYSVRSPFCYGRARTRMKMGQTDSGRFIEKERGSSLWSVNYANGSCLGYMTCDDAVRWLAERAYPEYW
jgi:hypothetical protein